LVHPTDRQGYRGQLLELGTFRIIESEAALDAVTKSYLQKLQIRANEIEVATWAKWREIREDGDDPERRQRWEERGRELDKALQGKAVLSFQDFARFNGHEEHDLKSVSVSGARGAEKVRLMARRAFAEAQRLHNFDGSRQGYRDYLKQLAPDLHERLSADIPALIPEKPRTEHTYFVSTTGTGKSELLKALCLNYVNQPDYAGLVVLDPGGDMVQQIARWPELVPSGRLVYVDPVGDPLRVPVINPFDAEGTSERDRALLTEQIVAAIGSLVEGKIGGHISVNMEAVLYPSIRLLVDTPGATIRDLRALMKDDERLVSLGCQSFHEDVAEFFSTEFLQANTLKTTKQSIMVKVGNILSKGVLSRVLCGRTSIDL
jgi:hypothetical protein